MSATAYEHNTQHRRLFESYKLDSPAGVAFLFTDYYSLVERSYLGDYAACDILLDLKKAIKLAGISDREWWAIKYSLIYGYLQEEVSKMTGLSQPTISRDISEGLTKIAKVFSEWNYGEVKK